jgi:hypothetical protein|tara:strand:- start:658 stop:1518 length:861 start_codon:yes stop_codon:yes gene_type:complete
LRNNEDRLGTKSIDGDTPPQTREAHSGASFSFSTPTEFVELPSGGRFYPQEHPLHGKGEIEIRHMTAKDEDILTSETLIKKGIAVERLLQNVIVDKSIDVASLLVGDKNALVIATRVTGYGADYRTNLMCPSCSKSVEGRFDLEIKEIYRAEEKDIADLGIEMTNNGTFILNTPIMQASVEVRLMTGTDEEYLNKLAESKKKKKLIESFLTDQLRRMIVSVNGDSSPALITEFVNHMPARDSRYLRSMYQHVVPDVKLAQEFSCASCGHTQELEVPFTVDFFWPRQ